MNGGGYVARLDPFGSSESRLPLRSQQGQARTQQQQLHNAYSEYLSVAAANNPCVEGYDPTGLPLGAVEGQAAYSYGPSVNFSRGNQPQHHVLMSVSGTGFTRANPDMTVAALNHLNFPASVLAADSFKNQRTTSSPVPPSLAGLPPAFDPHPYALASPASASPPPPSSIAVHTEPEVDPLFLMASGMLSTLDNVTPPPPVASSAPIPANPEPITANEDDSWLDK